MPNSRDDWMWAMGLFEGEGCISNTTGALGYRNKYLRLQLRMTDEDVIRRFGDIMGCGNVTGPYPRPPRKPIYSWQTKWEKGA